MKTRMITMLLMMGSMLCMSVNGFAETDSDLAPIDKSVVVVDMNYDVEITSVASLADYDFVSIECRSNEVCNIDLPLYAELYEPDFGLHVDVGKCIQSDNFTTNLSRVNEYRNDLKDNEQETNLSYRRARDGLTK